MEADERTWIELLAQDLDADAVVKDVDEEGYERDATIGIRLSQAIHHGPTTGARSARPSRRSASSRR